MRELVFRGIRPGDRTTLPGLILEDRCARSILDLGLAEANLPLVFRALHRRGCGRGSVFGLLRDLPAAVGATAVALCLGVRGERMLRATLWSERAGRPSRLPCRPVEAVLVAVRLGAPIFASDRLMTLVDQAGDPVTDPSATRSIQAWRPSVRPEDVRN